MQVFGSNFESISQNDKGRTSPLSTNNFNELWTLILCGLSKEGRIALINEGTAVSLLIEYAYKTCQVKSHKSLAEKYHISMSLIFLKKKEFYIKKHKSPFAQILEGQKSNKRKEWIPT